jgi:hypothetical protein
VGDGVVSLLMCVLVTTFWQAAFGRILSPWVQFMC